MAANNSIAEILNAVRHGYQRLKKTYWYQKKKSNGQSAQ